VNAWKVVCATLVIFIAGIVTGASLVRFAQRGSRPGRLFPAMVAANPLPPSISAKPSPGNPRSPNSGVPANGLLNREFLQVLEHHLRLSPDQREDIGKIMTAGQLRIRELRTTIEPRIREEMQATREQIRSLLTPEQREQFEQLMKQRPGRRSDQSVQPERERRLRDPREPRNSPPDGPPASDR
jgi:Spy/CpxP family protein refolding chaperone